MADPISGAAVQQLQQQAMPAEQVPPRREANQDHQEAFEQALNGVAPVDTVEGKLNVQPVDGAAKVSGAEPTSLGDALLDGLDRIKVSHDNRMKNVSLSLQEVQDAPMSVGAAMKLQFELMQMSIEHDLTSKVADKTSQGVQTLFRNSG